MAALAHRPARLLVAAVALLLGAGLLASCSQGGDVHATATFDDVADLADGAPVQMADITVGEVASIDLDDSGTRAEVELAVDRDAGVPAAVVARVRRTSPLGEKFIELRPTDPNAEDPPLLEDGATIENTEVVPDLEQLVGSGTDFFAALGAGELAVLLDESAEGFGGQGENIRTVLESFETVAGGFAEHTEDIERLVVSIDQLASDTGPAAQAHADALGNLADTVDVLDDESDQLLDVMASLAGLSAEGDELLEEHADEMAHQIDGMRSLARAVASEQASLADLITGLEGHNEALQLGVRDFFTQVLNDFVICGIPGGGDDPNDRLNTCGGGS